MNLEIEFKREELSLKELEIIYNPDIFNCTNGLSDEFKNLHNIKKILAGGILLIALNSINSNTVSENIEFINSEVTLSDACDLVTQNDLEEIMLDNEINNDSYNTGFYDEFDQMESEIIENYMKEVKNYYPKNNPIVL